MLEVRLDVPPVLYAQYCGQRNRELRRGRHGQDNRAIGDVVASGRYASRHRFVPDGERVSRRGVERGNTTRPSGRGNVHCGFCAGLHRYAAGTKAGDTFYRVDTCVTSSRTARYDPPTFRLICIMLDALTVSKVEARDQWARVLSVMLLELKAYGSSYQTC